MCEPFVAATKRMIAREKIDHIKNSDFVQHLCKSIYVIKYLQTMTQYNGNKV